MNKMSSLPENVRYEIIGYLAQPHATISITAEVAARKCADFESKYDVAPYSINSEHKYGEQFRLYLSDPEGCPSALRDMLDIKRGRLNDTKFIRELVDEYGFMFFQSAQSSRLIRSKVKAKGEIAYNAFMRGFNSNGDFLSALREAIIQKEIKPLITVDNGRESAKIGKTKPKKSGMCSTVDNGMSEKQLLNFGWLGEQYFYNMLLSNDKELISALKINDISDCSIKWFNKGFENCCNWTDKSVGEGCDIVVQNGAREICIEVKSSKRVASIYTMTSLEMQKMQQKKEDYYVVKIDNMGKLVMGQSPNVKIITSPYEVIFNPKQMQSANFYNF